MIAPAISRFPEPVPWQFVVAAVDDVTPHMRRIQLTSPDLDRLVYLPGQDLSLGLRRPDGTAIRRRYTIRRFDRRQRLIELNVLLHGGGPGMRWSQTVKAGDATDAIGPRGKVALVEDADWHLFAGDATAVPGALAMMEALPAPVTGRALLQVDGQEERQPAETAGPKAIQWHYESSDPLALAGMLSQADLPEGRGHAYLAGEVALVRAMKATLIERGWSAEQISPKAYWNRGEANAGNGEPEQRAR